MRVVNFYDEAIWLLRVSTPAINLRLTELSTNLIIQSTGQKSHCVDAYCLRLFHNAMFLNSRIPRIRFSSELTLLKIMRGCGTIPRMIREEEFGGEEVASA